MGVLPQGMDCPCDGYEWVFPGNAYKHVAPMRRTWVYFPHVMFKGVLPQIMYNYKCSPMQSIRT